MVSDNGEDTPLLAPAIASTPPKHITPTSSPSPSSSDQGITDNATQFRSLENDVLPETLSPLGRSLSWQSAYILVISRVIGSGIFATPGTIITAVGSPGLSLLLWLVGAAIAACGLSVALEYGCMLPRSGGDKVYLEFTYRRPRFLASTLIAMQVVLLGFTASNCVVFSQYVLFAFGNNDEPTEVLRKGLAVSLLTVITIVHSCFRNVGIRIQNVLGWIKIGLVVFMILCGLYVVAMRPADFRSAPTVTPDWDRVWADSNWNWGVISTALFKVFYSYAGLENLNNVMNEVKDPVRTLRSVSLTALATACIMYFLVNLAYFIVVPVDDIKGSGELIAALFFERLFGHNVGGKILPLAVALSAAGNVMVVSFAMARVKQEIARQGFLPFARFISSTKPFNSPAGAFIVHYIPTFLVITLPPSKQVYSFILEVEGYPGQIFAIAVSVGLLWLRYKRPELKRPFRAWVPAVILRIILSLALLTAPFIPPEKKPDNGMFYASYAIVGVSIIIFGFAYWYVWTVLIPRWKGYKIEEEAEVLDDGTAITKLVHIPIL